MTLFMGGERGQVTENTLMLSDYLMLSDVARVSADKLKGILIRQKQPRRLVGKLGRKFRAEK